MIRELLKHDAVLCIVWFFAVIGFAVTTNFIIRWIADMIDPWSEDRAWREEAEYRKMLTKDTWKD